MRLKKRLGVFLLVFLLFASPVSAASLTVNDVADELICLSGCNMVLSECTCCGEMGLYLEMMSSIREQVDSGRSKEQIIQSFVTKYGEQVLVVPPKRGFNLVAWILPFAAILAGGGVIYLAIKAWVRRGGVQPDDAVAAVEEEEEEKYQHQLETELKEFAGGSFR